MIIGRCAASQSAPLRAGAGLRQAGSSAIHSAAIQAPTNIPKQEEVVTPTCRPNSHTSPQAARPRSARQELLIGDYRFMCTCCRTPENQRLGDCFGISKPVSGSKKTSRYR